MALVRAIHLKHWDHRHNEFKRMAFSNLGEGAERGVSTFDLDCALERSGGVCAHLSDHYSNVAGDPPCYWVVPGDALPAHANAEWRVSRTGDVCHVNVTGLTDGQARRIAKTIKLDQCCVCDDASGSRPATIEDLPPPLTA